MKKRRGAGSRIPRRGSKENPDGVTKAAEDLKAAGYNAMSYVSEGTAHEFLTWRRCLYQMVQKLFK